MLVFYSAFGYELVRIGVFGCNLVLCSTFGYKDVLHSTFDYKVVLYSILRIIAVQHGLIHFDFIRTQCKLRFFDTLFFGNPSAPMVDMIAKIAAIISIVQ